MIQMSKLPSFAPLASVGKTTSRMQQPSFALRASAGKNDPNDILTSMTQHPSFALCASAGKNDEYHGKTLASALSSGCSRQH